MPNYILWGADPQARETKARRILQDHFVHSIESEGKILKVKEVQELLPHWHVRPPAPWKRSGLLVLEAQRMNEEVQNTLLKTLEEPPGFLTFVFTVPHPKLILPTLVSRCLVTKVAGAYHSQNAPIPPEILHAPAGKRLSIFEEKISYNRESALAFLDELEQHFADQPNPFLKEIWETKKVLRDDSTNVKMAVDCLLLSW